MIELTAVSMNGYPRKPSKLSIDPEAIVSVIDLSQFSNVGDCEISTRIKEVASSDGGEHVCSFNVTYEVAETYEEVMKLLNK